MQAPIGSIYGYTSVLCSHTHHVLVLCLYFPEPELINHLRSSGIGSFESIPGLIKRLKIRARISALKGEDEGTNTAKQNALKSLAVFFIDLIVFYMYTFLGPLQGKKPKRSLKLY